MRMLTRISAGLLTGLVLFAAAIAAEPDEILADAGLEERAQALDEKLRCVVCQSQSLAESNAPLAKDMRILVRERISAGDTDEEAVQYLADRYGDYVLLMPPVQENTIFLWLFPALALFGAGAGALLYFRGLKAQPASPAPPLSDDDEEKIQRIIDERRQ